MTHSYCILSHTSLCIIAYGRSVVCHMMTGWHLCKLFIVFTSTIYILITCHHRTKENLLVLFLTYVFTLIFSGLSIAQEPYLGSFMGTLSNKDQGISGHVYSVDENTVYLKNFTFSGTGSGTYSLAYYFLYFPIPRCNI